ncbi:roadblock/LC7 domain-containing protein [candidate division WOR-3 bacterium]|nr:roadblock/LC7 domain-containing protein [candidate division WOR-3 bacterium]
MSYEHIDILEEDFWVLKNITSTLQKTIDARVVVLIDRSGQPIVSCGETEDIDILAFSSLVAADYAATSHLAGLIGENAFATLHHQGIENNIFIQIIENKFILAIIFKSHTPLGRVKVEALRTKENLTDIFQKITKKIEEDKTAAFPTEDVEIDNFLEDFFEDLH